MLGWILLYLIVAAIDQASMGPVLNLGDLPLRIHPLFLRGSASWMADLSLQATDRDSYDCGHRASFTRCRQVGLVLRALDIAITSDRLVLVIPATHEARP